MKWLNPDHALKSLAQFKGDPQTLVLFCEVSDIATKLPVKPRLLSTEEGVASPVNEWVGLLGVRPIVVRQTVTPMGHSPHSVEVLTPFMHSASAEGEWMTLRELEGLPLPIRPSRPLYIESHTTSRDFVVHRPNSEGWDDPIYQAASGADAEKFVAYLKAKDPWNDRCFIGRRDAPGRWGILKRQADKDQVLGAYPDADSALRVACDLSSELPDNSLVVRDISETPQQKVFQVSRGRVEKVTL